jgi:hypothetical protein
MRAPFRRLPRVDRWLRARLAQRSGRSAKRSVADARARFAERGARRREHAMAEARARFAALGAQAEVRPAPRARARLGARAGRLAPALRVIGGQAGSRRRRVARACGAAPLWLRANWARYWAVFLLVLFTGVGVALGMGEDAERAEKRRAAAAAATAARAEVARQAASEERQPRRGSAAYYARTARKRVSLSDARAFLPLHREAGRRYGVSWRLLASIHRQETAFSTAATTYHGLNDFGCCAGPMQFNVTNGPVSTWERYRQAFRAGGRPKSYPHRTRHHPSIYDDFDAIMAAASLLRDSGAGTSLDGRAWQAAFSYYGHDLYGVTYANEVLARAVAWERDGFCPNCALDLRLVEQFESAYGRSARKALESDERRAQQKRKQARERRARARARRARERRARLREQAERRARELEAQRTPARERPAQPPRPDAERAPSTTTTPSDPATPTTPPETTTTAPAPAPPPKPCSPVEKLLGGCR